MTKEDVATFSLVVARYAEITTLLMPVFLRLWMKDGAHIWP